jgi:hypothetical protein
MIHIIFDNFYFKLGIAVIMALLLTFSSDIKILYSKIILISILFILLFMIIYNLNEDMGIIILLVALFLLSYNNVIMNKKE